VSRNSDRPDSATHTSSLDDDARSWLENELAAVAAAATTPEPAAGRPSTPQHADPRLRALLELTERRGASDLHLSVGSGANLRHDGVIRPLTDIDTLTPADVATILDSALAVTGKGRVDDDGSVDGVIALRSGTRVRMNLYRRDDGLAGAFRILPDTVPSLETLGLPPAVADLAGAPRGLLLLTGATGSGKTTTIAALIEQVIGHRAVHVITLEDPIEYRYTTPVALVTQRQIGDDTSNFPNGLRQALRQDPDVIVIGEMRDAETIAAALTAAETGHLVLATLHSRTAQGAVSRIVESFGEGSQNFVRAQLADALIGVVSQQLVPAATGGRVLATEVLTASTGVASLIREGKLHQIGAAIDTGGARGMQSMDRSLAMLLRRGLVTRETAMARCVDPAGIQELIR
jgi:twitching motility protein PilT